MSDPTVSLLFPAYNRLEFTKQAWGALMANTDWSRVAEFHVYDDGSTDGTREWLEQEFERRFCIGEDLVSPTPVAAWRETSFRSPMGVTLDWIRRSRAPMMAKLDNDTIYPPHWLGIALDVMERHPKLDMLGLECMRAPSKLRNGHWWPPDPSRDSETYVCDGMEAGPNQYGCFGYLPAIFISGLGLYRRAPFASSLPQDNGYFGLEEWQQAQRHLQYGWILPSLPTILLDRMPTEPWKSLSESYVKRGWQRPWSLDLRYKMEQSDIWSWWRPIE